MMIATSRPPLVDFTDEALEQVMDRLDKKGHKGIHFGLTGGGCAGFSYVFNYADGPAQETDIEIEITSGIDGKFGYCSVKDNGRGISRAEQERIFEKFYRVEDAMTQKTRGTGLGLSLVKHIMDAHQGHIDLSSRVGDGSIFTLKFPLISN